jgi:hypothetical protein
MLGQKLNYSLKVKNEQQFIYTRLNLFDQYYCLDLDLKLQQSYLDTGLQQHSWPVRIFLKNDIYMVVLLLKI